MKRLIMFFIFMVAFAGLSFAQQDIDNCLHYKEAGGGLIILIAVSTAINLFSIFDNKKTKQSISEY